MLHGYFFQVVGLCGNMDNNKDNDFTSFSNSFVDGPTFLGIYSDCREASYTDLSSNAAVGPNLLLMVDKMVHIS